MRFCDEDEAVFREAPEAAFPVKESRLRDAFSNKALMRALGVDGFYRTG